MAMMGEDMESFDSGPQGSSYGRACQSCTKSKTRCAYANVGGSWTPRAKCERCSRLNKECILAPKSRSSKSSKPGSSVSSVAKQTAALEKKLDGIVQMLQNGQNTAIPPASVANEVSMTQTQTQNESYIFSPDKSHARHVASSAGFNLLLRASQSEERQSSSSSGPTSVAEVVSPSSPTVPVCGMGAATPATSIDESSHETQAELEEILRTYRNDMMHFFPVVPLDPETTVDELRNRTPFLWLVLRTICSKNQSRQRALGTQIRVVIGHEILLEGSKSLDLLLGLLVYASWGHIFVTYKPIISPIIHLATSVASDLGLTRPVPEYPLGVMLNYNAQGCPKPPQALEVIPRTMEERRTILGLFLISSIASIYFQRIEPLRWTPYLEECTQILFEKKEFSSDEELVYLVRVQLICNNASTVAWSETYPTNAVGQRFPRGYYSHLFKNQLEDFRRSLPPKFKASVNIQMAIRGALIGIHEHCLLTSGLKGVTIDAVSQMRRIEDLWICYETTKSFFEAFFDQKDFPPSSYPYISLSICTQFAHFLVALFRLSTFESPDVPWDRQLVLQELDVGEVIRKWLHLWELAPEAAGLHTFESLQGDTLWEYTRKALSIISNWWDGMILPKLKAEKQSALSTGDQPAMEHGGFPPPNIPMDPMDFTGVDLGLFDFNDMLGSGFEYLRESYF